jgi:signal peptidase I
MNLKRALRVLAGAFVIAVVAFAFVLHATYRVYAVQTGSMSPGIPAKSVVVVEVGHYKMGEPISFHVGHEVVTHRLVGRNGDGTFVTKGDGNNAADFTPVPAQNIVGGVVLSEPNLGFWLVYVTNPLGAASIAMSLLLLYLIWGLFTASPQSEPATGTPRPRLGRCLPFGIDLTRSGRPR